MIKIAASILSADFSNLTREIKRMEDAGVDMLHIDVMDGRFVPNITIGPQVIKDIRRVSSLIFDVHLMIEEPIRYIDDFIKAGSDMLTVHIETSSMGQIKKIKEKLLKNKIKLGIALNPPTSLESIRPVLEMVDLVLVMTVNPGFGGQRFISSVVPKIKKLRSFYTGTISVDGGINDKNASLLTKAGADILASGSYLFSASDTKEAVKKLKGMVI